MKKLLPLALLTFLLLTTAHALFFAGRSVSNYRSIGGIKIDKMGGKTTGIKKINGINFRKKVFDPTEGLVGWWKFDGDARDSSGNDFNANPTGTTILTYDRNQNIDSAYQFNGLDSYIVASNRALKMKGNMTLSLWVKFSDFEDGGIASLYGNWGFYNYALWFENDVLYFEVGDADFFETKVSSLEINELNKWYHIVGTYNENRVVLYVDSEEKDSISENRAMSGINGIFPVLCIGNVRYNCRTAHSYNETNAYFNGSIDDVRIYNRALTPEEVQTLYEKY